MARNIKCQQCLVSDTPKDEMKFDLVGKNQTKKYFHHECYDTYLKEKAFKEKERVELDGLVEVIKEIYGVKQLPHSVYPFLQELRNGTRFFGKYDYKYKQGYSYALIAETFNFCSETIEFWNANKKFNGFSNALRYGLAIVCDKLSIVEQRQKQRESQKVKLDKYVEKMEEDGQEFESSYQKPSKSKNDISDFLDD